ncbi:MAG: NAD-dependent epimerase/dehydratase family protein [Steroidobacteraceae bacterium]
MRCLIIGGTRVIGPHVVRRLHVRGWDIAVLHRGVHRAVLPGTVRRITDESAGIPVLRVPLAAQRFAPDVVLHMIAMGERDAEVAMDTFAGHAARIVVLSSGDVYRAYGRFAGTEPGPVEPTPLTENAPLRDHLFPYRGSATSADELNYWYDKILVERAVLSRGDLPGTVLRLPKVYGPDENADLATVYGFRRQPQWRWTHGNVENVAEAITLAVVDPRAANNVFNLGEAHTPTMAERLDRLPDRQVIVADQAGRNFDQDIAYDTSKIRRELGFVEVIDEIRAMTACVLGST